MRQLRVRGTEKHFATALLNCCILAMVVLSGTTAAAEDAKWRADGRHVLVVYRADDADRNANGVPDSKEAAAYYAARRGVPAENLLGLTLALDKKRRRWSYPDFYDRILKYYPDTPWAEKAKAARDRLLALKPGK